MTGAREAPTAPNAKRMRFVAASRTKWLSSISAVLAAAFALQGQIRMCRGDIADAVGFYDKAIEMSEPGSAFHRYLLLMRGSGPRMTADDSV